MRAVGYLRISTAGQADGFGLDVQRDALEAWAEAGGHELGACYQDVTSGVNGLEQRDGLASALATVADGATEGIVVARLDRLARDMVLQETLLREIARAGGMLCSADAGEQSVLGDTAGDPSRKLIRQILGAVAEFERELIALRLAAGKAQKLARGGYVGGRPPFGWRARFGELVEDDEQQRTLESAARWRREGRSLREIASMLNETHRPTSVGRPWDYRVVGKVLDRMGVQPMVRVPSKSSRKHPARRVLRGRGKWAGL
jgi:DNA invertase Pin-like site-specific DNA recombinase